MRNKPYLIISKETGTEYRRKTIKRKYKNITNAQIYRVYEIRKNVGSIVDGVTIYKKEEK